MDPQLTKLYEKWGVSPPTSSPHGTDDDIRNNLVKLKPKKWRQEGNKLIGETEMGDLVQFIDTGLVLMGTDKKGNPILNKPRF